MIIKILSHRSGNGVVGKVISRATPLVIRYSSIYPFNVSENPSPNLIAVAVDAKVRLAVAGVPLTPFSQILKTEPLLVTAK